MTPCPTESTLRTHPARHAETVRVSPERSWTGYVQAERPSWKDSRSPGCCCGTVAWIGAESAAGRLHADAVILAAGVGTRKLARTAAVRAPILPVKGYAATVPVTDRGGAPRVGGVLENRHVAFSRMGDRLRCRRAPRSVAPITT